MAGYLGRQSVYGAFEKQVLSPNGTLVEFALDFQTGSSSSLLVVKNGAVMEPGVGADYTLGNGGSSIVFAVAPANGADLFILFLGREMQVPRTVGSEVNLETFTGTGAQTAFVLVNGPVNNASILVFVNGTKKRLTTDYTVAGNTITFGSAPANAALIDVYVLGVEKLGIYKLADGAVSANAMGLTWSTYTPTWSSPNAMTVTPGSNVGKSIKEGKKVTYRINSSLTIAGTLDNTIQFTLPFANDGDIVAASNCVLSVGGTPELALILWNSSTQFTVRRIGGVNFTNATWTVMISGIYVAP